MLKRIARTFFYDANVWKIQIFLNDEGEEKFIFDNLVSCL
jgi:hypothetical protein